MSQINVVEKIKIDFLNLVTFSENYVVYKIMSKNLMEPGRPQKAIWRRVECWINITTRGQGHACATTPTHARSDTHSHARLRHTHAHTHAHTHTFVIQYLILFHGNGGFVNEPQCYVIRTLSLLFITFIRESGS